MFKLIRWALNIAISVIIFIVILYFLPDNLKRTILDTVDSIVSSPAERREQIINKLENNIVNLQNQVAADPNVIKIIEESKKLISDLKANIK